MPWTEGILFYDMAQHFAGYRRSRFRRPTGNQAVPAGSLVGAMESFDAVSKGSAQIGHDWPSYWKGQERSVRGLCFSVLSVWIPRATNIWLYERGGLKMMQDPQYNLYALPGGNGGRRWACSQQSHENDGFSKA